jgi:hypothetical protein
VVVPGEGLHGFLVQIADAGALGPVHRAGGWGADPGEDAQQRRLADSVRADQPDLASVGQVDADAAEDISRAER